MWFRFTARASKIFPDRTAFYYRAGGCYDLPPDWCAEWVAQGVGEPGLPPQPRAPEDAWTPPPLGHAPLTVACVRRSGGVYDRVDYVGPLARAVARHLDAPHRFVCLSDRPDVSDGVEHIPLRHGWPGFWSKVELYRPGLFAGSVLYLDLDTVVCGDIAGLAAAADPLLISWDMQHGWINSSLVRWSVDLSFVYDALCVDPVGVMRRYESGGGLWGDQGLLQEQLLARGVAWRWAQEAFPERIRWHQPSARHLAPEPGTCVSLWYGHPKPHEATSEFLAQHWR